MTRFLLVLSAVTLVATAATAQYRYPTSYENNYQSAPKDNFPNWYLGLNGTVSFVDDIQVNGVKSDSEAGYGANVAIGYRPYVSDTLLDDMRFEVQSGYYSNEADLANHRLDALATFVNAYYDFNNSSKITPYIGGGAGFVYASLDDKNTNDDTDTAFAYQVLAGLSYAPELLHDTELVLGYRFVDSTEMSFNLTGPQNSFDYQSHNIDAGFRFRF